MRGLNREMAKMSKFKLGTTSDSGQLFQLSALFSKSKKSFMVQPIPGLIWQIDSSFDYVVLY